MAFIVVAGLREYHGRGAPRINYCDAKWLRADCAIGRANPGPQSTALIDSGNMTDPTELRKNTAPWWGLLFGIAALGCNGAFFVNAPLQRIFPWLSLLLAVIALSFLVVGLRLVIVHPKVYRGKVLSVVLTVIALLPAGLSVFGFVATRKLPSAAAAPQVGQRVPDFTLFDTSGKPVSLDQLLAASPASSTRSQAPKAVLLIFYRGYW
jgi:hypothetical protein